MNNIINKYLIKRSEKKWHLEPKPNNEKFSFIICIPSYSEDKYIKKTLQSIKKQNKTLLKTTLIIIVINNGPNEHNKIISSNKKTITIIKLFKSLNICFVDAFSKGNELPKKYAGVGFARKIGLDLSLTFCNKNTILCNLDADALISKNYLETIKQFYNKNNSSSAVVNFKHVPSKSNKINQSIKIYEQFLKITSKNLKSANSPYYYHSIGSTITCTSLAYASVGGMSKKIATEDFYFLESLAKYRSVEIIENILVFPSSRISERVYLGTGYRMKQSDSGFDLNKLFFDDSTFIILKKWLLLGKNCKDYKIQIVLSKAKNIDINLPKFLINEKIEFIWEGLQKSSPSNKHFELQFHRWFDALKTLRLLKFYSN